MLAYKLLKVRKDGSIGSLFIERRARRPIGEWLISEDHQTKGFAHRPGFHCTAKPEAPHLSLKERKWYVVEIEDYEKIRRPESQGGIWYLAKRMKILEEYKNGGLG